MNSLLYKVITTVVAASAIAGVVILQLKVDSNY